MLEHTYKSMNEKLTPSPALVSTTLQKMEERRSARRPVRLRRVMIAATALVLTMALSVGAMAAAIPGFRDALFGKDSKIGNFLTPVTSVMSEENGIRMEVLGAMSDRNNVIAYFTLQDTRGENRLSPEMYLNIYAKLNGEYPAGIQDEELQGHGKDDYASVLEYDPETQTAFCRYEMAVSGYDATKASVRLRLDRIWYGEDTYVPLELSAAPLTTETLPVTSCQLWDAVYDAQGNHMEKSELLTVEQAIERANDERYFPFCDFTGFCDETGTPVVLKPGEPLLENQDGSVAVTAVGFIGGKLHVQIRQQGWSDEEMTGESNSASVYLAPVGEGEELAEQTMAHEIGRYTDPELMERLDFASTASGTFQIEEQVVWNANAVIDQGKTCYTELVYDICTEEELTDYDCVVRFEDCTAQGLDLRTEEFSTTGELSHSAASYKNLTAGGIPIDTLDITALGVYVSGLNSDMKNIKTLELVCGEKTFPHSISYNFNYDYEWNPAEFTMKFVNDCVPVEPESVTAVRINGTEIPLK